LDLDMGIPEPVNMGIPWRNTGAQKPGKEFDPKTAFLDGLDVDLAADRVNGANKGLTAAISAFSFEGRRILSPRTVAAAHFPALDQLGGDLLPVEGDVRIEAAHLTLLIRLNLILAHFHHVMVLPADFDGQVAKPLPGRDEGVAGDVAHGRSSLLTDATCRGPRCSGLHL